MQNKIILIILLILSGSSGAQVTTKDFISEQKKYQRVKTAFTEKETEITELFSNAAARYPDPYIFIRIFKSEKIVELWAKSAEADTLILLKKYKICAVSGDLGPKRRQGDLQIPEGFYKISGFNPVSMFYLSLRVNYPNKSDRMLGNKKNLGGDIFIHGNCVTIGCIPITDDKIKELYIICLLAKAAGNNIPVHIFPFRFNNSYKYVLNTHKEKYRQHFEFWKNIKAGFDYFERHHRIPNLSIDSDTGYYNFGR